MTLPRTSRASHSSAAGRLPAGCALIVERLGVRHVVVGGRLVVEDGRLTAGDMAEIESSARQEGSRFLWELMATIAQPGLQRS